MNSEAHTPAKEFLLENNTQFFTYTPKEKKPINLILKGIRGDFTADKVKTDLVALDIPQLTILKVFDLSFKHRAKNFTHFLVQLSPDRSPQSLTNYRYVLHQKVHWEKLVKPDVFLCMNCLQIGHSGINCNLDFHCSRCNHNHAKGE